MIWPMAIGAQNCCFHILVDQEAETKSELSYILQGLLLVVYAAREAPCTKVSVTCQSCAASWRLNAQTHECNCFPLGEHSRLKPLTPPEVPRLPQTCTEVCFINLLCIYDFKSKLTLTSALPHCASTSFGSPALLHLPK